MFGAPLVSADELVLTGLLIAIMTIATAWRPKRRPS
jgi:hypothetical protein